MRLIASLLSPLILRIARRLRFPQLFMLTAGLFVLDLLIPDLIPFLDEFVLGLATLLLRSVDHDAKRSIWNRRRKTGGKTTRM